MNVPAQPATVEVDFVTPRHLAGSGDPAWITVPLHRASGWSHGTDPLMPRVLLSSPDQMTLLRLEPELDGHWWTLTHAAEPGRPAWYARFDARTPVELIAAVTDTLTGPTPAADTPRDPFEPLRRAGWSPYADANFTSPDKTAYVERVGTVEKPGAWFITVILGLHQQVWQARFGEHTPAHLVTAFTTALADTKPLLRTRSGGLTALSPDLVTRKTTKVLATLVAGALEERVRSLTSPAPTQPTSATPPRKPPDQHGHNR